MGKLLGVADVRTVKTLAFLIAFATLATSAHAHEIGTTRAVARVTPGGQYAVTVTTDATVLLARLQLARHLPRTAPASATDLQHGFDALCSDVVNHVRVAFDKVASSPRVTCLVDSMAAGGSLEALGVTVTLAGDVPSSARTFGWRYDLTAATYALTVSGARDGAQTVWLEGGDASADLKIGSTDAHRSNALATRLALARTYFGLGFVHILPKGLDHILFVLGIFFLSRRLRPVLAQVSAFTVAHSITLGLTLYGVISLPSSIVEPMIALSIVYVAIENVLVTELKPWRVALVFAFGLLHGMGFAGVLRELALPRSEFVTGLVSFNAGVEAGQLTVILVAFVIFGYWARNASRYRRLVVVPASTTIALTGAIFMVERLL